MTLEALTKIVIMSSDINMTPYMTVGDAHKCHITSYDFASLHVVTLEALPNIIIPSFDVNMTYFLMTRFGRGVTTRGLGCWK